MSARDAITAYLGLVRTALDRVDAPALERFVAFLSAAEGKGATVHVAGDGGSAALAEHLACDFAKLRGLQRGPEVRSLVENPALLTMLANDHGFDEVFARQVAISVRPGDGLLLISGSGRSPNLIRAAEQARSQRIRTFALLGFGDGGPLARLVDDALVVPSDDYRVIEDVHHSLGHAAAAALWAERADDRRARVAVVPREILMSGRGGRARPEPVWLPGAGEAVALLRQGGWKVAVIDDEPSGVELATATDGRVDLALVCGHGPDGSCRCRRPSTGLLDRAAEVLGVRPDECVLIGDGAADAILGQRAGARTILVGSDALPGAEHAPDLAAAVSLLLRGR